MSYASRLWAGQCDSVDLSRFESLGDGFADRSAVLIFARNFLELLPRRVHRITSALDNNDTGLSLESVLSLKIASAMIGGSMMENKCAQIERAVRSGKLCAARQEIPDLKNEASALGKALSDLLPTPR